MREDSKTTKLRVVFNGSSKTSSASSLNDHLHIGPSLQSKICDVLLYLRSHRFIFLTDIVKMFRQVLIHPDDRDYQRILWTENGLTVAYQLNTVTNSTRPAPYLAGRALKQLLIDEGSQYPLAVEPFQKGSYVDDIGGGADNLSDLNDIANNVEALCNLGCFPLAKWKSNHPQFSKISSSLSPEDSHSFSDNISKILGLSWNCQEDVLTFTGKTSHTLSITKRTITSEAAQLFDLLGLISPVIVKAKIIIQDLWLQKVDWDDSLSPELVHRWTTFRDELPQLSHLRIPRWINLIPNTSGIEIHGFSEASQAAMSAVIYLRVCNLANRLASLSSALKLKSHHSNVSQFLDLNSQLHYCSQNWLLMSHLRFNYLMFQLTCGPTHQQHLLGLPVNQQDGKNSSRIELKRSSNILQMHTGDTSQENRTLLTVHPGV
ncbi:uncharacterized protein LOC130677750 [Microplitis mediator]|uniref:uncharacterized protein LOC130677750 n=1 Tax=Microplitis mediator TaxID=375433 RepID=UPI002553B814|nr:uncharacterized protein LOC130677750 [Microplitis mediator]